VDVFEAPVRETFVALLSVEAAYVVGAQVSKFPVFRIPATSRSRARP
jgi:hypothetical protein